MGPAEPQLGHWLDRLKDRDPGRRAHAATVLASLGPRGRDAIPALTEALDDKTAAVRRTAAMALAEMGPAARVAIPSLIALLHDDDESVRCRAIVSLGQMGSDARTAAPALIQLLADPDDLVRRYAASALGDIGPMAPTAIPALIEALAHDDMKNRAVTIVALTKMGTRAVPRLIEALKHDDARVRRHAARVLGKCSRGLEAVPALLPLLHDPDPLVRETVEETLEILDPDDVAVPEAEALLAASLGRQTPDSWPAQSGANAPLGERRLHQTRTGPFLCKREQRRVGERRGVSPPVCRRYRQCVAFTGGLTPRRSPRTATSHSLHNNPEKSFRASSPLPARR